jgi:hypothetical protein
MIAAAEWSHALCGWPHRREFAKQRSHEALQKLAEGAGGVAYFPTQNQNSNQTTDPSVWRRPRPVTESSP